MFSFFDFFVCFDDVKVARWGGVKQEAKHSIFVGENPEGKRWISLIAEKCNKALCLETLCSKGFYPICV